MRQQGVKLDNVTGQSAVVHNKLGRKSMRTRTGFKLEEARFFLAHLEKHWRHVPQYEFYLSAFISAARSVTWVMRYEY
jgi:hypothetical protein